MLRHQAHKLDLAQFARASAFTRVNRLSAELTSLQESRLGLQHTQKPETRVRAWDAQQAGLRIAWFEEQEMQLEGALREATASLHEAERHLRVARTELKKFELLKERRKREWQSEVLKLEQKQLDEIGGRQRRPAQFAATGGNTGQMSFRPAL